MIIIINHHNGQPERFKIYRLRKIESMAEQERQRAEKPFRKKKSRNNKKQKIGFIDKKRICTGVQTKLWLPTDAENEFRFAWSSTEDCWSLMAKKIVQNKTEYIYFCNWKLQRIPNQWKSITFFFLLDEWKRVVRVLASKFHVAHQITWNDKKGDGKILKSFWKNAPINRRRRL